LETFVFQSAHHYHLSLFQNSVKSLENSCFEGCSSLSSLNIQGSVAEIGAKCFQNCLSLQNFGISLEHLPKIRKMWRFETYPFYFVESSDLFIGSPFTSVQLIHNSTLWERLVNILNSDFLLTEFKNFFQNWVFLKIEKKMFVPDLECLWFTSPSGKAVLVQSSTDPEGPDIKETLDWAEQPGISWNRLDSWCSQPPANRPDQ
jgi:hypothetical protein